MAVSCVGQRGVGLCVVGVGLSGGAGSEEVASAPRLVRPDGEAGAAANKPKPAEESRGIAAGDSVMAAAGAASCSEPFYINQITASLLLQLTF